MRGGGGGGWEEKKQGSEVEVPSHAVFAAYMLWV